MAKADKRTEAQLRFDMAAHGWAFCNQPMLRGKVEQLRELVEALPANDARHVRLRTIEGHLHDKA